MNNQTIIKDVHVTPKKIRFLTDFVKKLKPVDAVDHLTYMPQHSARVLKSAIQAAISSSVLALKTVPDMLKFKVLTINQGHVLKRFRAGGRGTAKPIKRRLAHIKIILNVEEKTNNKKVKITTKKSVLTTKEKTKLSVTPKQKGIKKSNNIINNKKS